MLADQRFRLNALLMLLPWIRPPGISAHQLFKRSARHAAMREEYAVPPSLHVLRDPSLSQLLAVELSRCLDGGPDVCEGDLVLKLPLVGMNH